MSIAHVALFAAIVQTVVASNGTFRFYHVYNVSACTRDADCRQFGDLSATCIAGACECTRVNLLLDSSDHCSGTSPPTAYEPVHVVFSFDYPCDLYFGNDLLASFIQEETDKVAMSGTTPKPFVQGRAFSIAFACVSTNATALVVSGKVQIERVVLIAEKLAEQVSETIMDVQMMGTLTDVSVTLGRASTCRWVPPVTQSIEVSGTCVPVACEPEYTVTLNRTEQATKCVKSPPSVPSPSDSDDDLSDGAIAGIVVGSVMGAVLIIAVVVLLVGSKKTPTQENNKESEPTV